MRSAAVDSASARGQAVISGVVLLILGMHAAIAQIAMRHDALLIPHRVREWKQINGMLNDSRFFANADERLLYQVIPSADYSHGGVYFTGASVLQRSLMLWDLPHSGQADIHNYCVVGASHTKQAQFIRYLVEHENLLQAGGEKTCIITELAFASACHSPTADYQINDNLWRGFFVRYGLFTYDPTKGLDRPAMPELERNLNLFELQTHVFWSWALLCLQHGEPTYLVPSDRHDAQVNLQRWKDRFGPDWESGMDIELKQYADVLDYLQARHVKIAAIYMPEDAWCVGYPPALRYRQAVLSLLSSKGIPVLDLIHKVPDDGFADSIHLNYKGASIIQPDLVRLAEECDREVKAAATSNPR